MQMSEKPLLQRLTNLSENLGPPHPALSPEYRGEGSRKGTYEPPKISRRPSFRRELVTKCSMWIRECDITVLAMNHQFHAR